MSSEKTILLIEDEDQVNRFLAQLLTQAHWRVTSVRSGADALGVLSTSCFDVILCDLDLGRGISGLDVLRRVPKSASTKFVVFTGHGTIDRCREAFQSGVADFIEKPSSPTQLLSALDRVLGRGAEPCRSESAGEIWTADAAGDLLVRRALQLISKHCTEVEYSVAKLAEGLGVSAPHLARKCRDRVDRSPRELIHDARVAVGIQLLADRRLSVSEVAWSSGYKATKEFDTWFRRLKGTTPSAWRRATDRKT